MLESLPPGVLLAILELLDAASFVTVSQTSRQLWHAVCSSGLFPHSPQPPAECLLMQTLRGTLASILRVPPQFFSCQDDSRRSAKFCIAVPLYNLRGLMSITDVEGLAATTAALVQVNSTGQLCTAWLTLSG
jgi:hypothetical protein